MILCRDDINWLMPLLSHAAPKWKEILTSIGITNDHIMTMMESGKDGAMLLQMGMKRWVKQASATLGALAAALSSPEVGEGYLASEIVKGKNSIDNDIYCEYSYLSTVAFQREGEAMGSPDIPVHGAYPPLPNLSGTYSYCL